MLAYLYYEHWTCNLHGLDSQETLLRLVVVCASKIQALPSRAHTHTHIKSPGKKDCSCLLRELRHTRGFASGLGPERSLERIFSE